MLTTELIKEKKFVLIGAGTLGKSIYYKLKKIGYKPVFIADNNLLEDILFDDKIYIRNYNYLRNYKNKEVVVIVSVFNPKASFKIIKKQLNDFGFSNIVSFLELFRLFESIFLPFLNYVNIKRYVNELNHIKQFVNKLSDKKSIEIFNSNLAARQSFNIELYPEGDGDCYFPPDLFNNKMFDNCLYIDCGAYDGDTVTKFVKEHPNFGRVVAFEPDNTNYKNLLWNVNSLKNTVKNKILCLQAGVSNKNNLVKFEGEMGMGSKIEASGKTLVQLISIDDVVTAEYHNQNFVKLDVEGNELNCLKGMKSFVVGQRCSFAISVYHRFDDIWKIGNYIYSLNKNYNYYLRQHGNDGMDLVLYCKRMS